MTKDKLKEKGIEIIVIHSTKIDREYLDNWLEEKNINFPISIVESNEEQIKFTWGVKALPWLILTNKDHIVTIEGFLINDLDEIEKNK